MTEERYPSAEESACDIESVDPTNDNGPETVVDCTTPLPFVERILAGVPETVRLVVDAETK